MVTRLNCIDALGSFNKCRNDLVLLHSLGREMLLHSQDQLISGRVRTNVRQLEVTTVLAQCVCIQFVKIHPLQQLTQVSKQNFGPQRLHHRA